MHVSQHRQTARQNVQRALCLTHTLSLTRTRTHSVAHSVTLSHSLSKVRWAATHTAVEHLETQSASKALIVALACAIFQVIVTKSISDDPSPLDCCLSKCSHSTLTARSHALSHALTRFYTLSHAAAAEIPSNIFSQASIQDHTGQQEILP